MFYKECEDEVRSGDGGGGTNQVRFLGGEGHRISRFHLVAHVVHLALDVEERTALARRADDIKPYTVRHVLHLVVYRESCEF